MDLVPDRTTWHDVRWAERASRGHPLTDGGPPCLITARRPTRGGTGDVRRPCRRCGRVTGVTRLDPAAATADIKRTATLLRDARSVLRRIGVLMATAAALEDPALGDIAALRDGADRLVSQLAHREQAQQRRAREAVRRLR